MYIFSYNSPGSFEASVDINQSINQYHASTSSASVLSEPTFPGNTTYGTPTCRLVGSSHRQRGTPGAACPTIKARLMFRPLVAASEDVIPPFMKPAD